MIHGILTGPSLNFTSASHEPCLYKGTIDGQPIFLLRQVDDFAVSAPSESVANLVFSKIQAGLTQPLKLLGLLAMFNGIDIVLTSKFVKLDVHTYIEKILDGHNWSRPTQKSPLSSPMNHDKKAMKELELATGPTDPTAKLQLEKEMEFSYRQAIGELLFAAITCRPDILYAIIKLSQYNTRPARVHYMAVKRVFRFLRDTKHDGLH